MSRPRARHLVLVVAGTVLIGSGLALPHGRPRADAPAIDAQATDAQATVASAAATPAAAAAVSPTPSAPGTPAAPATPDVPPSPAAPGTVTLPGAADRVPLVPVGVLASGALQLPERPTVLGWFAGGAAPGDPAGTAVIAGHVDSAEYGAGPLEALLSLAAGDVVEVTDVAGGVHRYAVASRESYPKDDGGVPAEVFRRDGPAQLALITCGGAFDERTGEYADNVLVLAVPVA